MQHLYGIFDKLPRYWRFQKLQKIDMHTQMQQELLKLQFATTRICKKAAFFGLVKKLRIRGRLQSISFEAVGFSSSCIVNYKRLEIL